MRFQLMSRPQKWAALATKLYEQKWWFHRESNSALKVKSLLHRQQCFRTKNGREGSGEADNPIDENY